MKVFVSLVIFFICHQFGFSQNVPTAAPTVKGFSLGQDNLGAVSSSVNLFTGDVNLPINLVDLQGRNGLDVNVTITYSSNVQNQVDTWNLEAPAGILGLGWNMDMPKIVADTKQTGTREDDTYYIIEGGTSNRLIRTTSGSDGNGSYYVYETKNYQFWKIKFYYDGTEISNGSGANKWEIIKENGFKYIYGDKNSGRQTIQYVVKWDNWIGNSAQSYNQGQLASAWNLSEVINLQGEKILFEYDNEEQYVGNGYGRKQTEASYLKQITDVIGRKVIFSHSYKESSFYMEPHTEQPEPDAYQEVYEKKYLDHIDVINEVGNRQLAIKFRYSSINTGTNKAKMLLTNIEQRNASNNALPGTSFEYYMGTDSNGYKGFLKKINYPTGGSSSYNYIGTASEIGHSQRDINIESHPTDADGPYGYGEPQIWHGTDYVVIAWRALGPGGTHNSGPAAVKLYVYQWVGEWKRQFLQSIYNVSATIYEASINYKDFQVVTEDNFFAVLSRPVNNNYQLFLRYKNEQERGNWMDYSSSSYDFGDGLPTLMSGDNYIAVGSFWDNSNQASRLYTFVGNNWREEILDQPTNQHNYASSSSYFISHERNSSISKLNFNYLSEDKNWITKSLPTNLSFTSDDPSNFYASNSFFVAMADNNPEFIYRWDLTKTNFYRDDNVLGAWNDASWIFNVNNSQVGLIDVSSGTANGIVTRFDGQNWISSNLNAASQQSISFGNDYALYTHGGDDNHSNESALFNPNSLTWTINYFPPPSGQNYYNTSAQAGQDFFNYRGREYFRTPNGQWNNIGDYRGAIGLKYLYASDGTYFLKNASLINSGDAVAPLIGAGSILWDRFGHFSYISYSSPNTIVGYLPVGTYGYFKDAVSLHLYRAVGDRIKGKQLDYPVSQIIINDGTQSFYTSIDYNNITATLDPTGSIARYAEVKLISGSATTISTPNGFTKSYFNNGLTNTDDSGILCTSADLRLLGTAYETRVMDFQNSLIAKTTNTFTTAIKEFFNSNSIKVDVGAYSRPYSKTETVDNITSTSLYGFDINSGLSKYEVKTFPSYNGFSLTKEYTYWWEKYDPSNSRNILTPMTQTIEYRSLDYGLTKSYLGAQVTRWKNFTAALTGLQFPVPVDNYAWKRTGSGPNTFSTWDPLISPPSDWELSNRVNKLDDNTGMVLETVSRGNIKSAIIYDQTQTKSFAQVTNAGYNEIAYSGFEDNSKGNWSWTDGTVTSTTSKTGNTSISIGTSGITKTGLLSNETYIISYWFKKAVANNGSLIIDGVGNVGSDDISTTWNYYEYKVKGLNSITIKNSGTSTIYIDDLRFYPARARMTTQTYHPYFGVTSQTDANNLTVYTEYDEFGRVKNILDNDKNILSTSTYNFKK